ncbi:MAG: tetratricopeptide repeat protein [Gammaproteobacteria bacterium]
MLRSSTDSLSLRYLELLVRMKPEDPDLRLMLVRKLTAIGYIDEARRALAQLPSGENAKWGEAKRLSIQLDHLVFIGLQTTDPKRAAAGEDLIRRLQELKGRGIPSEHLEEIARISLVLDRPDLAAECYLELSEADVANKIRWLKQSARWFIASGSSARAGLLLDQAASLSPVPEQSRALALEALKALHGAMAFDSALKLASGYLEKFPDDRVLASRSIDLALAANRLDLAKPWARKLASISGNDPAVLTRQLDIELAANDLEAALSLAERLLAKAPEDDAVREQAAQIAEWAEQPARALDYWVPLARKHPLGSAMDNAVRLAGVHDEARLVSLLAARAQSQRLSTKDLWAITEGYREIRDPAGLWAFLRGYVALYPAERLAWELLAHALDEGGRLDEALAVLRQAENALGRSISSKRYQAEIWERRKEPQRAFSALLEVEDLARRTPGSAIDYWRQYSQLARELKQFDAFEIAYDQLSQSGAADLPSIEQWIILLREGGKSANAIQIAEGASTQFKEPRLRLLAMDIAAEAGRWNDVGRLRQSARKTNPQYFEQNEMYWLLSASLDAKRDDTQATMEAYERALQLNPKSNTTKAAALWQLINTGDLVRLRVYLSRWRADAREDPVLWPAYAAGFMKLGNAKLAVPWFARRGHAHPHDALWLLSFADALDQAGRQDAAWKVRRHVFLALRTSLRGDPQMPPRPEYVRLLLSFDNRVTENELTALLGSSADEPNMRDLVVGWHISRQEFESARRWLLRGHAARQATPAWQRLAVALSDDDKQAVESILKNEAKDLTVGDHVRALRQGGRPAEALETLQRYIDEKS